MKVYGTIRNKNVVIWVKSDNASNYRRFTSWDDAQAYMQS